MNDVSALQDVTSELFGKKVQRFLDIHTTCPIQHMILNQNIQIEALAFKTLDAQEILLPVTRYDGQPHEAWVCSPLSTYSECLSEEAQRNLSVGLAWPSVALAKLLGLAFKSSGAHRAVSINNWLMSTNLYPRLSGENIPDLIGRAVTHWPTHGVWFRSLNRAKNNDWINALQSAGCYLVATRQVYLYDDLDQLLKTSKNLKHDLKQLSKTHLQRVGNDDIVEQDYSQIARLYAMLYMQKYSRYNPHYTAEFMRAWHRSGLLVFSGFRDEKGQLVCIAGIYQQADTLTTPIVGYDTNASQGLGLYRLLMACVFEMAIEQGLRINFSAGAAEFKRLRGGKAQIEYSAVYVRHLPLKSRMMIALLSKISCGVVAPLMKKYQL